MAQLSITRLNKSYGENRVLRDVSLDVDVGEFMTIVGPSGCGKSTLLRIVAGLDQADTGSIRLGNIAIDGRRPRDRDVAMVFQSYALYPHKTVRENIATPLKMRRLSFMARAPLARFVSPQIAERYREIDVAVRDTAATVGLEELLARKPAQLSGGQRQRVAIARAVVRGAPLTLMDEPFSSLDTNLREQMRAEITRLHKTLGNTILFVTHDAVEAMALSDRVAVMVEGKIVEVGRPQDLYRDPGHLVVAKLLSHSSLNVLPGTWRGESLRFAGTTVRTTRSNENVDKVEIGVRPEAIRLYTGVPSGPHIRAQIDRIVYVGSDLFVQLRALDGGHVIVARCPARADDRLMFTENEAVALLFDQLLVFDGVGVRRRDYLASPMVTA